MNTPFPLALGHPEVVDDLAEAYLPVIEAERWRASFEGAKESEEQRHLEWVAFAPGREQSRGITLPDSRDPKAQVSLFSRIGGAVCQLSINYPAAGEAPSGDIAGRPDRMRAAELGRLR